MRDEYDFSNAHVNPYVLDADVVELRREIKIGRNSGPPIPAGLVHTELRAQFGVLLVTCNHPQADAESPK
jgi:hypothetical protein